MTIFKKGVAFLLVFAILAGVMSIFSFAASEEYIEISKNSAPIRASASQDGKVLARCDKGTVLIKTGTKINSKLNKWYKVKYDGKTAYIFSGNVKTHSHKYNQYSYAGINYKVCKGCGNIVVLQSSTVSMSNAAVMASYAATAGGMALADSPFVPVGDIVAVAFLALGAYYVVTGKTATGSLASDIVSEIDFEEYLKSKENVCSIVSFRKVKRINGTLKYEDNKCLDLMEAYISVRYAGKDVYTQFKSTAESLAKLHVESCKNEGVKGEYYFERDKNQPAYFYHYHLKTAGKKIATHIFYGTNGFAQMPT